MDPSYVPRRLPTLRLPSFNGHVPYQYCLKDMPYAYALEGKRGQGQQLIPVKE